MCETRRSSQNARGSFGSPRAQLELIDTWHFLAEDIDEAADRIAQRIIDTFEMLSHSSDASRARPDLGKESGVLS